MTAMPCFEDQVSALAKHGLIFSPCHCSVQSLIILFLAYNVHDCYITALLFSPVLCDLALLPNKVEEPAGSLYQQQSIQMNVSIPISCLTCPLPPLPSHMIYLYDFD